MKKLFLIGALLIIGLNLFSQSSARVFTPEFINNGDNYLSDKIEFSSSKDQVAFIGMSCYHNDTSERQISYRLLKDNKWGAWINYIHNEDLVSESRTTYEADPIKSSFQSIQFKSDIVTTAIIFRCFIGRKSPNKSRIEQRSASCDLPDFCDRTCWCQDCPIDPTPEFTDPTHIIVHHSAGFNQSDDFASVVEYYYDLHTQTNGWDDIGYNWLIDANGFIYEGRPDGYQGAHFSCLNENTVGICMIGDFTSAVPSDIALRSLVNLIGYEATEHVIDVTQSSYHESGDLILENISGHRDGNASENGCSTTVCPGDQFYPLLDTVIYQVNQLSCYENSITSTIDYLSSEINIYPNPFNSTLYIVSEFVDDQELYLINSLGIHMGHLKLNTYNYLSHLSDGLYFVVFKGRVVDKVIKE